MATRKIKTPVTYRPSKFNRWQPFVLISLLFIPLVNIMRDERLFNYNGAWILVWLALIAFTIWWSFQSTFYNKLIVWDHGLEVYLDGVHRFVLWEDMERFGTKKRGKGTNTGVFVSRFEREEAVWFARLFVYDKNFIALNRIVPTPKVNILSANLDVDRFSQTPFGQDLLYFAPHLFDDEKAKYNE